MARVAVTTDDEFITVEVKIPWGDVISVTDPPAPDRRVTVSGYLRSTLDEAIRKVFDENS